MKRKLLIALLLVAANVNAQDTLAISDLPRAILEAKNGNFVSVGLFEDESTQFPEAFFEIPTSQLVGLVIDNCQYASLPDKLKDYQQLVYFRYSWFLYSDCPNTQFPSFLTAIPKLQSIQIEGVKLGAIPESIGNLKQLKSLSIYSSELSNFPSAILQLRQLTHLDLSCNKFTSIPDGISQLNKLTSLHFDGGACGATPIDHIPASIGELTELESLSLGYSKVGIKQLPESFFQLKKMISFDCNGCGLERLSAGIGNFSELQNLSLSNMDQFAAFPSEIFSLTKLNSFRFYLYGESPSPALMNQKSKFDEWGKRMDYYSFEIKGQ